MMWFYTVRQHLVSPFVWCIIVGEKRGIDHLTLHYACEYALRIFSKIYIIQFAAFKQGIHEK